MSSPTLTERITGVLNPFFPSATDKEPDTQRSVFVELDSRNRVAFDSDGLANDFVGTGYFLVTETTGKDGWFSSKQTTYRSKRFSYFLNDTGTLVLRELNPNSGLYPTVNLNVVPRVRISPSGKHGPTYRTPTFEEARSWALARSAADPISAFVGNIDAREGNEAELMRGVASLGIVNLLSQIFPKTGN